MEQTKRCSKCGETLPLRAFYRAANGWHGYKSICKLCDSAYTRAEHKRGKSDSRRQRFHKAWVRLGLPVVAGRDDKAAAR